MSIGGSAVRWVAVLCWVAVALDGFVLVVLGALFVGLVPRSPAEGARGATARPEAAAR